MKLTARMLEVLREAARNPLRRNQRWPAHPATLAALVRHGLLERTQIRNRRAQPVDVWTITALGRETLNPPPKYRADRPRFIARPTRNTGDYTTNPTRAIDHLEVIDWQPFTRMVTQAQHLHREQNGVLLDAKALQERLELARSIARCRKMDITGEDWLIRRLVTDGREQTALRRMARLETQLRARAA